METLDNSTASVESTSTVETSAPVETQASTPEQAVVTSPEQTQQAAVATPPPAYTPNWKYKANDQEHEIPEDYRAYIKSQEDEKKLKRLFQQTAGVDSLKSTYQTTKSELDSYKNGITAVNKLIQGGDFMKAFQMLGWSKDMAYKAAKQFLDFDELPQQQQQVHNQAWQLEQYNRELMEKHQALQEQMATQQAEMKKVELNQVLTSPEIKSVIDKYDSTRGQGAFRQEVIKFAYAEELRSGRSISAQEAVEAILGFIKPFQAQQQPQASEPKELPVIPATKGNGGAPAKSFKSIDDIKTYRKQQYGF